VSVFVYLVPMTIQNITFGGNIVPVLDSKYAVSNFACISFGIEGLGIYTLPAPNAILDAADDCYGFPLDLSAMMQNADVAALVNYLATYNVPTGKLQTGQTFTQALLIIAALFLAAQAIFGQIQSAIFVDGTTLSTTVANSSVSAAIPAQSASLGAGAGQGVRAGGGSGGGATSSSTSGAINFGVISGDDTVEDSLNNLAQQISPATITVGGL
jgi:hypothetical protein